MAVRPFILRAENSTSFDLTKLPWPTCWTTVHLMHEREAAELLGIPYETHTQVALIPTAWTLGTGFRPSLRKPVDAVLHIDGW